MFMKIKLTYGFPPGGIAIGGLRAGWWSNGGRYPFSALNGIGPPGNPGRPNGGTGSPAGFNAETIGPAAAASVGDDFGVACFSSEPFLTDGGAGVDEADEVPLRGLTGSFLAWLLRSPFSFEGGLRREPFCKIPSWNENGIV